MRFGFLTGKISLTFPFFDSVDEFAMLDIDFFFFNLVTPLGTVIYYSSCIEKRKGRKGDLFGE